MRKLFAVMLACMSFAFFFISSLALSAERDCDTLSKIMVPVKAAIAQMSEREQLILRLRFQEKKSLGEIGKELAMSELQVSRIVNNLLRNLRKGSS